MFFMWYFVIIWFVSWCYMLLIFMVYCGGPGEGWGRTAVAGRWNAVGKGDWQSLLSLAAAAILGETINSRPTYATVMRVVVGDRSTQRPAPPGWTFCMEERPHGLNEDSGVSLHSQKTRGAKKANYCPLQNGGNFRELRRFGTYAQRKVLWTLWSLSFTATRVYEFVSQQWLSHFAVITWIE